VVETGLWHIRKDMSLLQPVGNGGPLLGGMRYALPRLSHLQRGGRAVVLAAEWHTVDAVLHLDWLLRLAGMREQVALFWNANNTSLNFSQFVAAQKHVNR
jgi:hypothetical protein